MILKNSETPTQNNLCEKNPTWSSFVMWFHKLYDRNWDDSSYTKVSTFNNLYNFWGTINNLPNVNSGMYFLKRENILPQWENEDNIDGGYISYKIDNSILSEVWKEVMLAYVGGYLTKESDNLLLINGVSVSPKKFYGIIKIWIKDHSIYTSNFNSPNKIFSEDIPKLNNLEAIYQKNSDKS